MRALIQRVHHASVVVAGTTIGAIDRGILVFLGVQRQDSASHCDRLASRVLNYRIFADAGSRMNLSVRDVGGAALVVSQFTLAADTAKGLRPSFTPAAEPEIAESLYRRFVDGLRAGGIEVATGSFGADMQVSLCNDGPVTFLLEVPAGH